MSVDVATLVFEFKSNGLPELESGLDSVAVKSDKAEAAATRLRRATDHVSEGHRGAAGAAQRAALGHGAVEQATRQAAQEMARAERTAEVWRRRIENIEKAMDPASAVTVTLAQRTRDLDRALAVGGISAERHALMLGRVKAAAASGDEGLTRFARGVALGGGAAKLTSRELMNLSFQANDVFTSMLTARDAGDVLRVLGQQTGQVAQVFQEAGARGVGFRAAMLSIGAALTPVLAVLAPIAIGIGAVVGAFALFEREVDKSTKNATTWGDTWNATVHVIGKAIMDGPIGDGLRWLGDTFDMVMNAMVDGAMSWLDRLVGFWGAAYLAIVKNWRNLPQAIGAIMVGAVNGSIETVEGLVNATIKGINRLTSVVGWKAIAEVDLPRVKQASNAVAAQFEKDQARIEASFRKGREGVFGAIAKEADRLAGARKKATDGANAHAKATNAEEDALAKSRKEIEAFLAAIARDQAVAGLSPEQVKIMDAQAMAAKAIAIGYDTAAMAILRYVDALILAEGAQKALNAEFVNTPADIKLATDAAGTWIERMQQAVRKYQDVQSAGDELFNGIKSRNWSSAFSGLLRALEQVQQAATKTDKAMAALALADAAGNAIGGKGGRAISSSANAGASAFMMTGNPYIAAAAAALAGLSELLKSKPSNEGAGYSLATGAVTGKSRTADTERAARSAADIITGGQDLLRSAGLTLTETIHGLVIGTRDLSQVYTTGGRTVTAAVGDVAAAADAGLRAVLETATYASAEQEKLAKSALAAGKSFDDVMAILDKYTQAQAISAGLADQILQITDPKAFDLAGVTKDIEAQRKAYQQLATDGYLTAAQLLTINGQLSTLEALRLDEVMKRYADSVDAANDNLATLRGATESAEGMLLDAYNTYAEAKRAEIEGLRQAASALRSFRKELDFGAIAGRDPVSQLAATRREFERLSAMSAGDPERVANLQGVSQAFLEASKIASPTELAFNRDLQAVRRATEASELAATAQADYAQMQLDAQTQAVGQLISLNATAISIEQAMFAVLAARANEKAGGGAVNDNLDVGRYAALNPDLVANWNAGGVMRNMGGSLEEALRSQYATYGKDEISKGLRTYATGGMHPGGLRLVGEEGPEIEATGPARIYSARDTARMMGGDTSRLEALVEKLTAEVTELRRERTEDAREVKRDVKDTADTLARVTQGKDKIRTVAA